jgi:phage shock protein A
MDRRKFLAVYERTKQAYNTLNDFLTKEYVKTKTLEDALSQLNEIQGIEEQLASLQEDKDNIKSERIPLEQEIAELEQKITELKNKGPIDKLNLTNAEIENLNNELKNTLRHLQKPFIKMQALATFGGGGGITPDELKKINQYLDAPFDALVTEQSGYPILREILEKLQEMLAKDTLKLKSDKARKAEQTLNEILCNDSLASLQIRCMEMANSRDQIVGSSMMDQIKNNIAQYQDQLDQLRARKTSVETHETVKSNTYNLTMDKINSLKRTVEKNVFTAIDKQIQIA